ncbi:MAG: LysR family transcriptional regulator [Mogibacterium sp.]|nr:LysR family transcriptional regulator [Mogibacterium sp.]
MTFRHLECALAIAQAGSINTAAKKMLVSQPYLSGMINSLEKELGCTLFIRSNQGIELTQQGKTFIKHAEKIMSEMAAIESLSDNREYPLRVATYYSRFVTEHFLEFHNGLNSTLDDRMREMGNMDIIEAVAKREYSLGIIYHATSKARKFRNLAEKNNLRYNVLFEKMGTYLIMSDRHPLAGKERIDHDDLLSSAVVFFDDESTILYMLDHLKMSRSMDRLSVSDRGAFMDALLSGRYLSIINMPFPDNEKMFVLKDISYCLDEDADIEVGSAYLTRSDHKLTKREEEFIRALQYK